MTSPSPRSNLAVPPELQRGNHRDRQIWLDSGVFAVELLSRTIGRPDLAGVDVLDVGCGTKIVKTLLDNDWPVGHYTGIDASASIIEFLRANVTDPRFEFHHIDARNELYNPTGTLLADFEHLPVGPHRFDLIGLFSVFTHLDATDFVAMLRLLRRHVKPDGRLLFSVFLSEPQKLTPYQVGLQAALEAGLESDDPEVVAQATAAVLSAVESKARGYYDEVPDRPLLRIRYEKDFAIGLVEQSGWEIMSLNPPEHPHIQHYLICRPA
jgi:SAM-dependent methyltransferase